MRVEAGKIREEIEQKLQGFVEAYVSADAALKEMSPYLERRISLPFFYDAMSDAMRVVINKILHQVTSARRGHTLSSITIDELSDDLTSFEGLLRPDGSRQHRRNSDLRWAACNAKVTPQEVLEKVLERLQPGRLAAEINTLADNLVTKGLREAAEVIQEDLWLTHYDHQKDRFKSSPRDIALKRPDNGYSHSLAERWRRTANALDVFTQEVGVSGISRGPRDYAAAVYELNKEKIPTGAKFGEGSALVLQKYKEHVLLRFQPDVFNALVAFLVSYAAKPVSHDALEALAIAA